MLNRVLTLVLFCISSLAQAQEGRYMVFFTDKDGSPYQVSNPAEYLGPNAIARRGDYGIAITTEDIPVNITYINGVKALGAEVFYPTRWLNGILVQLDNDEVADIEALPYVESVKLVAPGVKPSSSGRKREPTDRMNGEVSISDVQYSMLGINEMHGAGFQGQGITVAILDAGFPGVDVAAGFQHLFDEDRINLNTSYNFVSMEPNVFKRDDHGTKVLSIMAGYVENSYTGGAYKANYQLYLTEDVNSEHKIEEYNWLFAAERADSAGADVISSSLGYNTFDSPSTDYTYEDLDGQTAVVTRAANAAIARGIIVVTSAGNEGNNSWQYITAPADADGIIAVGGIDFSYNKISFSSIGPSSDGRIKPDVVALGASVSVLNAQGNITTASGTSFAAPLIACLMVGLRQQHPDLSNAELITAVRQSASQSNSPDNSLGYGVPNFRAASNWLDWETMEAPFATYPNPVNDILTLRPSNPADAGFVKIEWLTLQGRVLDEQEINFDWVTPLYYIDCHKLSAGIYLLRIWHKNSITTLKVMKNN